MKLTYHQILNLIKSCKFLNQDILNKWENNLQSIPFEFYPLIYRTFLEAKNKIANFYIKFELSRNPVKYNSLFYTKIQKILKLINVNKLKHISDKIDYLNF